MNTCSRPGCRRRGVYRDGGGFYCLCCRRVRQMVMSTRKRYPHLPITREEVEAKLIGHSMRCPLCDTRMRWGCRGRTAPKATIITIQHWGDGTWTFLCHRCNVRDGSVQRWQRTERPHVCQIPECEKKVLARGWCVTHYGRWKSNGDPHITLSRTRRRLYRA